jgi:glucose-6-phosphate 1-dehydrogenase
MSYILLMISNRKSVPEIQMELQELIGLEEAASFCDALGPGTLRGEMLHV